MRQHLLARILAARSVAPGQESDRARWTPALRGWLWIAAGAIAMATSSGATALTTSVTVAGSLQSELGCAGDWDPACAATHLVYDATDDVWQGAFAVPTGSWEYKAALNDGWAENYGANAVANGANIPLPLAADTFVKFYFDDESNWITDDRTSRIVTVPGSFQSELGCSGDWAPDCLRAWLQDVDGDGTYDFVTTDLPAGSYEVKAAIGESWTENYGAGGVADGPNIAFLVPSSFVPVHFSFVSQTNVLTVSVDGVPEPGAGALLGGALAALAVARRSPRPRARRSR
jgi:hypothetical protein